MKAPLLVVSGVAGLLLAMLTGCETSDVASSPESQTRPPGETVLSREELKAAMTDKVDFVRHVKPIFEARCVMCHNKEALPGRMSLLNRKAAVKSGALGVFIIPGHPETSAMVTKISSAPAHMTAMPPVGERITSDKTAVLKKWIKEGADWPEGREGRLNPEWVPAE